MITAGYQGAPGAYSEEAALRYFGSKVTPANFQHYESFSSLLQALESGKLTHVLLPLYNSLIGNIRPVKDALTSIILDAAAGMSGVKMSGLNMDVIDFDELYQSLDKVPLKVEHALLAARKFRLTVHSCHDVFSHSAAIQQCKQLFNRYPKLRAHDFYDTAGAAAYVYDRLNALAIAPLRCAEIYQLEVIEECVQDSEENVTTFGVLSANQLAQIRWRYQSQRRLLWWRPLTIRGATTVSTDNESEVLDRTTELLKEVLRQNSLHPESIINIIFTATPDIRAAFPAKAARDMGWCDVPMLCATEMDVEGALSNCIRVMIMATPSSKLNAPVRHVYLHDAVELRPDISATHSSA